MLRITKDKQTGRERKEESSQKIKIQLSESLRLQKPKNTQSDLKKNKHHFTAFVMPKSSL